jgi:hypothetical protein
MKQVAFRLGYSVTFMAKWNARSPRVERPPAPVALDVGRDGKNAFYDASA